MAQPFLKRLSREDYGGMHESGAPMAFSYTAVWDDTVAMIGEHGRLLAPVAGMFVFLPAALIGVLLPDPQPADVDRVIPEIFAHYQAIWPWLLLGGLIGMVGAAAMLRLVLVRGTSVGGAIGFGAKLLPVYFLVSLIAGLVVGFGLLALLVPGLYLWGRLAPAAALLVAENRRNPAEIIARSFEITRGQGWAVFGLVFLVAIVGMIATGVVKMIGAILFLLAAGQELGAALAAILGAALDSALSVLLLILGAAIFRALTGAAARAAFE